MINFLPLGGAGEIGASCYYLNIAGTGIILDCGMHPKKRRKESLPRFDLLENKNLDYVLISHAHQDHINSLPFLIKKFPYLKIITTPQTRAIAELTLHNAISILRREFPGEEIYTHEEADLLIQSIDYKSYNENFFISGFNSSTTDLVEAEFFDAGHILGSAGILLKYQNKKIFFTGDINLSPQSLLTGAKLPKEKIDILITESTYGATDSSTLNSWEKETERLTSAINKTLTNGGSVLIPVFALGKLQEILATIWQLMVQNKIPVVDIYSGGIGIRLSRIYDYNRFVVNYMNTDLVLHDIPMKDINSVNDLNLLFRNPSIVLASSGMIIQSTTSFDLANAWLSKKHSAIITVGYMDDETPGFKIAISKKGDVIDMNGSGNSVEVKCDIYNFRFSAHSTREDLLTIVNRLNPEKIIIVHGDEEAIKWLGSSVLKQNLSKKVYAPNNCDGIQFDN
jgi:cleavage and polyadenylation specificity factor subunit 3